jgi:hypothetical protein
VLRLQRKLGELHGGDLNALRRAYASLSQHVAALEEEARGMVAELAAFETQFIPPELVAQEVGVQGAQMEAWQLHVQCSWQVARQRPLSVAVVV